MRVNGNTVFVTGGGSGIGLALAMELSSLGNEVIVAGRDGKKLERATRETPSLHALRCDVTDEEEVRRALQRVHDEFGRLTILVNNAGIAHDYEPVADPSAARTTEEAEAATNLLGVLRTNRLALPLLLEQPEAAIVMMSSAVAYAPFPRWAVYSATKAAMHSLSRSLRAQLQGTGVGVFEVLPPTVDTDATKGLDVPKIAPERVARAVAKGLENDTHEIRIGPAKAVYLLDRISPSLAARAVSRATTPRADSA